MTKISRMDSVALSTIKARIEALLEPLKAELGVGAKVGHIKYGPQNCIMSVECGLIAEDGSVLTRQRDDFMRYAAHFGLKAEDFGREFESRGMRYRIVGLNPGAPRFPILAERCHDKRGFKFPMESVKSKLAVTQPPPRAPVAPPIVETVTVGANDVGSMPKVWRAGEGMF